MPILRIEHSVPDFAGWKRAFDSDPVGRERSGVRRYRITRSIDDPSYVMIDLEFDCKGEVWRSAGSKIMWNPRARIVETVETREY